MEMVIKFYEKSIGRKMLAAYLKDEEYEAKMTEGLQNIKDRSERLARKKGDADILESRQEAKMQNKLGRETLELTRAVGLQTSSMENMLVIVQDGEHHETAARRGARDEKRNELLEQRLSAMTPTPTLSVTLTQSMGATTGWTTTPGTVWSLLHVPQEVENIDMRTIEARRESLPVADQGRTEQVINLQRFHNWIVSPHPAWLPLHGESTNLGGMAAMSLFFSALTTMLGQKPSFLALTWFCGMHTSKRDWSHGGKALLRNSIAQLLCQQQFDTTNPHRFVDLGSVQRGELEGLCALYSWLMRQLQRDMTVICIVDELGICGRDDFVVESSIVLSFVVGFLQDRSIAATLKLFATSTTTVRRMREFFPEGSVVDLSTVSDVGGSSLQRLRRQMGSELRLFWK